MSLAVESPFRSGDEVGAGEIMLFGVRMKVDPMRKSVSMNNLSEYERVSNFDLNRSGKELPKAAAESGASLTGYASDDDAVPPLSVGTGERKRGVPWTEEEHKRFLIGLQKVGKGEWRRISRDYVKTRSPTQVASHAQKYFLRQINLNRRRRRSSLFDMTTDSITAMEEGRYHHDIPTQTVPSLNSVAIPATSNVNVFSVVHLPFPVPVPVPVSSPMQGENPTDNLSLVKSVHSSPMLVDQVPICPSSTMANLNLNEEVHLEPSPLSLRLSLSTWQDQPSSRDLSSTFRNGDSFINVG